jgi:tryptophan-rich sensory protein
VIFGVTIIVTLLLLPLLVRMRWPKTAALLVALLWLAIALLMLLGTGERSRQTASAWVL